MTKHKCEICGAETNNAFKTSVDWVTHNVAIIALR